ncbi:Protein TIFY 5A [Trifolium repens]|nr:Protein TIFY 5A [Trifolium repens]
MGLGFPAVWNKELNVNKHLVVNIPHHKFEERELQARVMIWLASQEMEEKNGSKGSTPTLSLSLQPRALLMHTSHGFSVKRSLQNFLEKRKKRIQSHIVIHDNSSTN